MFITFEGIEGSGKSTQINHLHKALEKVHFDVEITREPGWGAIGNLIRKIILENPDLDLEPLAELSLFCADRAQHVKDFIRPMLNQGKIVLCDRFYDSTIAYQGFGRGLNIDLINLLNDVSTKDRKPDLTILLDMPVKDALFRTRVRQTEKQSSSKSTETNFEKESLDFHIKVSDGFKTIAKNSKNWVTINGALEIDQISKLIWKEVKNIL